MAVRGHTLLWYKRTPDWFWSGKDGQPASRDLVLSRLRQHIETVVELYISGRQKILQHASGTYRHLQLIRAENASNARMGVFKREPPHLREFFGDSGVDPTEACENACGHF